ncbi:Ppx/GppA phosphatase [Xylariaceae sp. FL0662B]|nr:Ppx/GppA phosphatase [Xylariaceae sp. FL0662B]
MPQRRRKLLQRQDFCNRILNKDGSAESVGAILNMASIVDIITLENVAVKMSPWDPDLSNHLYALVDMGSNGIRFSISDLSPPQTRLLRCLYRERAAISLYDALNSSSSNGHFIFPPDIITQVSETLARFKSIANDYGVPAEHVTVFATEAVRKAENAASMLNAILASSGLGVHVLSPEVETLFGAMGARSGFTKVNGLFLDLGGGSVQMTYVNSSRDNYETIAAQTGKSLPFGAAKLIEIIGSSETQAQGAAVSDLQAGMRSTFAGLRQSFPELNDTQTNEDESGVDIYLYGGGFRGYGSILQHNDPIQPYAVPMIGAYTVEYPFFSRVQYMRQANAHYEGKIFGMSKRRRHQFPAIATVVEALIHAIPRIHTITFCNGGNREGALLMKLSKAVRESDPLPLLRHPDDKMGSETLQSVVETVQSALPANADLSTIPTVFTLGLGQLFVTNIWKRAGEPSDANAAFVLHQAVTCDPSAPGFTHLARAVLGLTLCSRWGANLGPIDGPLYVNLQRLVSRSNLEANFWAEYLGTIASLLAYLCPAEPAAPHVLTDAVKFGANMITGKKKTKVQLTISLCPATYQALYSQDLASSFKKVGKHLHATDKTERKVEIVVQKMV